ncbi:MAG TPA: HAD family phosphatase [Candidatus Saccharimonadales bacterium]|nr:HAD family phosphatase [Candidatus Saccharimonadales bacterium]
MARAVILDYNGVIVNDEPLHLRAFQGVLAGEGIRLDDEDYFARYLGLSDRRIAIDALKRLGGKDGRYGEDELDDAVDHILARKAMAYRDLVRRDLPECPGAPEFVRRAAARFPVAVASGALRVEVEDGLYRLGIRDEITAVVAIEDVARGKPDPETFLRARDFLIRICTTSGAPLPLDAAEPSASFLVVEDSPAGLAAARAAWMPAVGVTTSRPAGEMKPAAMVVASLADLDPETIAGI